MVELNIIRMQLRRLEYEVHALGQKVYQPIEVPKTKADAAALEASRKAQEEQDQKDMETPVEVTPEEWGQSWMRQ